MRGWSDLPSHGGGQQQVVARLCAARRRAPGREIEMTLDTSQVKLFAPKDGPEPGASRATDANRRRRASPATVAGSCAGSSSCCCPPSRPPPSSLRPPARRSARSPFGFLGTMADGAFVEEPALPLDTEAQAMVRTGVERLRLALYWDPGAARSGGAHRTSRPRSGSSAPRRTAASPCS